MNNASIPTNSKKNVEEKWWVTPLMLLIISLVTITICSIGINDITNNFRKHALEKATVETNKFASIACAQKDGVKTKQVTYINRTTSSAKITCNNNQSLSIDDIFDTTTPNIVTNFQLTK